jgi:glucose/arabinose dehydrogenase
MRFTPFHGLMLAGLLLASACQTAPAAKAPADSAPTRSAPVGQAIATVAASSYVPLVVPSGEGGGAFSVSRKLKLPPGWTARVWARVPGARMEAWTPEGGLLVSQPYSGAVTELVPDARGTARARTLLSGLTMPQGLAFAKVSGHWVLYVGESDEIDRYPWGARGIDGRRSVIAGHLPDLDPAGDDVHRVKDVAVARDGTVYFNVGSSSNANPDDLTMKPPRAVIEAVQPDGEHLRVIERGVRNGEGLAVAPDGVVWTAVNNRDNIPYPFHSPYDGHKHPFGQVISAYVNNHPPDEVVPVTAGRDLGWPYCNPDQDKKHPGPALANVPFVPDALTNPGGRRFDCDPLPPIEVGLPAHSAPLGMSFLEGSRIPAPWSGGAVIAAHGSWDREPPQSPAVLWLRWDAAARTLEPAVVLVTGFQYRNGSRWGRAVDAVPGPDGALYVSDDLAGAIYRLQPPKTAR